MQWGDNRKLDFSRTPMVMGIINCTPDSFYPGSRRQITDDAVETACRMAEDGADILDVGGESTRPGSDFTEAEEELERIIPVIEKVRERTAVPISADTRKKAVAEQALKAGADIINDISALRDDPSLGPFLAEVKAPVILMHMRGTPKTMQKDPYYEHTVQEIAEELEESLQRAVQFGIDKNKIIVDPGIGFGKRFHDNLLILKHLSAFKRFGCPLMVGLSRKGFLGAVLSKNGDPLPVEQRLIGSLAANSFAALAGADILRVHDVKETVEMVRVLQAVQSA